MCDDIEAFIAEMKTHNVNCGPAESQPWGLLTHMTLPGGGTLGVYQPRHARPEPMAVGGKKRQASGRAPRKPARPAARKVVRKAARKRVRR
jgi:hypothetical protein